MPQKPMNFADIMATTEGVFLDRRGFYVEHLDTAVEEAARKSKRFSGKSEIALKITFEPGRDGTTTVASHLTIKTPQPEALPLNFYVDKQGRLVQDDPEQLPLGLVEEMPTKESKG
jgi:hypothetical protein